MSPELLPLGLSLLELLPPESLLRDALSVEPLPSELPLLELAPWKPLACELAAASPRRSVEPRSVVPEVERALVERWLGVSRLAVRAVSVAVRLVALALRLVALALRLVALALRLVALVRLTVLWLAFLAPGALLGLVLALVLLTFLLVSVLAASV